MAKSFNSETFVVQNVVLSYPNLFQAQQINGKGDPIFSAKLYLDPTAAGIIMQKAQQLAGQAFLNGETNNPNFRWPISQVVGADATNPRFSGFYVGNSKADASYPPQVVDQNRQPIMDRGQIYAGVVCAVGVRLYSYNNMGNVGISMGLIAVMKQKDGEHLVDGVDANSLFAGVQSQAPAQAMPMPGGMPMPQQMPVQQPYLQQGAMSAAPIPGMPTPPFLNN